MRKTEISFCHVFYFIFMGFSGMRFFLIFLCVLFTPTSVYVNFNFSFLNFFISSFYPIQTKDKRMYDNNFVNILSVTNLNIIILEMLKYKLLEIFIKTF